MSEETIVREVAPLRAPRTKAAIGDAAPPPEGADGIPLADALQILGGYEGTLVNPRTGRSHHIDLSSFRGRDPDRTFVLIAMKFVDPSKRGTRGGPAAT
jgi:hypothetical protein